MGVYKKNTNVSSSYDVFVDMRGRMWFCLFQWQRPDEVLVARLCRLYWDAIFPTIIAKTYSHSDSGDRDPPRNHICGGVSRSPCHF